MSRVLCLMYVTVFAAACSGDAAQGGDGDGDGDGDCRSLAAGMPAAYACKENPLADDSAAITAGENLWFSNCVVCHGTGGLGDGEEAMMFDPMPSNLIETMADSKDDYLLWRISDGGVGGDPIESAMPSWTEEGFTRDQIWQVIAFMRTLPN